MGAPDLLLWEHVSIKKMWRISFVEDYLGTSNSNSRCIYWSTSHHCRDIDHTKALAPIIVFSLDCWVGVRRVGDVSSPTWKNLGYSVEFENTEEIETVEKMNLRELRQTYYGARQVLFSIFHLWMNSTKMAWEFQQIERGRLQWCRFLTLPLNHELCQWIHSHLSRKCHWIGIFEEPYSSVVKKAKLGCLVN
jgi:hypothetical protein